EIRVGRRSTLAKVTLRESGLRDAGIQVLSITRGGEVLMNPRGGERVLAGDVLLCLGRRSDLTEVVLRRRPSADGPPPSGDSRDLAYPDFLTETPQVPEGLTAAPHAVTPDAPRAVGLGVLSNPATETFDLAALA